MLILQKYGTNVPDEGTTEWALVPHPTLTHAFIPDGPKTVPVFSQALVLVFVASSASRQRLTASIVVMSRQLRHISQRGAHYSR